VTRGWAARRTARGTLLALVAVALVLVGCAPGSGGSSGPAGGASPGPTPSGSPVTPPSPVEGLLVRLDSEGLTKVEGFRLRTAAGAELDFRIGVLENGAQFPPGHLAEHMATSSRVRVFFRDAGGERVVYRLEDAE